jgi:opacity protein-like surface antigen
MHTRNNIVLLAAIAAALHCSAVSASEEPETDAEVVNESSGRVEAGGGTAPDRRESDKRKKRAKRELRQFYFGVGFGDQPSISLSEVYRVRAEQRAATPLEFRDSLGEGETEDGATPSLLIGMQLRKWLDVELSWHDTGNMWQVESERPVFDPTLVGTYEHTAHQYSRFEETIYSLALLPRWNINDYVAIYARLGVGYAESTLRSYLKSEGLVSSARTCTVDGNCTTSYEYDRREWPSFFSKRAEFIPILGVGVQLFQGIRLEYLIRSDVPIGDTTTDITTQVYLSFRIKPAWFRNEG